MGQPVERGERLILLLSPAEATALDEFRRKNQLASRAEAIHEVLKRSLGMAEKPVRKIAVDVDQGLPLTKPMTKPWERAKKRPLGQSR